MTRTPRIVKPTKRCLPIRRPKAFKSAPSVEKFNHFSHKVAMPMDPDSDDTSTSRSNAPRLLVVCLLFLVVTIGMTFPDLKKFDTHIPGDYGDAMFSMWLLRWDAHAAPDGWDALWDTNIFYPFENTLAYSETYFTPAPFHWLIDSFTESWAIPFNMLYVTTWFLSLLCMYLLCYRFTQSLPGSIIGAFAYTFSAIRLGHYVHFQLNMAWMIPLILLLIVRLLQTSKVRYGVGLGVALGAVTLGATYFGVLMAGSTAVSVGFYFLLKKFRIQRSTWVALGVGGAIAAVMVLPAALRYLELQENAHFRRGSERQYAARPMDFLTPAGTGILVNKLDPEADDIPRNGVEKQLFPGLTGSVLGVIGAGALLVRARSRPEWLDGQTRTLILVLGAAALVYLVFSAGDVFDFRGRKIKLPYHYASKIPGLKGIRAASRFSILFQCFLSLLAAVGFAFLFRKKKYVSALAGVVLGVFVLAESAIAVGTVEVPVYPGNTAVNYELSNLPKGPVLELPIKGPSDLGNWALTEAPRQLLSTIDWNERVNGYSGFAPPEFDEMKADLNQFPMGYSMYWIDKLKVRYVVIRTKPVGKFSPEDPFLTDGVGSFHPKTAGAMISAIPVERVRSSRRFGEAYLIELRRPPSL